MHRPTVSPAIRHLKFRNLPKNQPLPSIQMKLRPPTQSWLTPRNLLLAKKLPKHINHKKKHHKCQCCSHTTWLCSKHGIAFDTTLYNCAYYHLGHVQLSNFLFHLFKIICFIHWSHNNTLKVCFYINYNQCIPYFPFHYIQYAIRKVLPTEWSYIMANQKHNTYGFLRL